MVNIIYKLNIAIGVLLLTIMSVGSVYAANIISYVDRNPVSLDESFQLTLEADGKLDANPDLSVLEKDFDILNTSQSNNMSYVNGTMSQKLVWTIVLMGKQAGTVTIPSIDFGKDKSPSLRVTIKNVSSPTNNKSTAPTRDVFLEVEVDQKESWVQSQIIYSVRIFHSVNLNNPSLSQIETSDKDAIIERLGDTKNYEAFRNGVRYIVSELNFAVFPQHSGKLIFNPLLLEGRIGTSRSQSIFDQFLGGGKIKRIRSKSLSINIRPRPDGIQLKDWLPAEKITLKEEWSENIQQLKAGEPVTRTITVTAHGQMAAYLPDLKLAEIKGLKQYPDKPVQKNTPSQKGVTGSRQIKIAMIPTKAGNYRIPEISISWWNTKTGKKEITRLPEVLLKATGAINTNINSPVTTQNQTPQQNTTADASPSIPTLKNKTDSRWPWISLILATGWLITLIAYIRKQPGAVATENEPSKIKAKPVKPLEQAVLKQCKRNNAQQTKDALLAWAKVRWPEQNTTSLADIAQLSPPALQDPIMSLNMSLYSATSTNWTGIQLSDAFETYKNQAPEKSSSEESVLEPLYKT